MFLSLSAESRNLEKQQNSLSNSHFQVCPRSLPTIDPHPLPPEIASARRERPAQHMYYQVPTVVHRLPNSKHNPGILTSFRPFSGRFWVKNG